LEKRKFLVNKKKQNEFNEDLAFNINLYNEGDIWRLDPMKNRIIGCVVWNKRMKRLWILSGMNIGNNIYKEGRPDPIDYSTIICATKLINCIYRYLKGERLMIY